MDASGENRSLHIYKNMNADELNDIVWRYIEDTPEDDIDADYISGIYELINEKDPTTEYFQDLPTYEEFRNNLAESYKESANEYKRLYKQVRPKQRATRVLKYVVPACVCFMILLFAPIAYGNSFFSILLHWGEGIATIRNFPPSGNMYMPPDSGADYASMAEALEQNGLPSKNIPAWVPEPFNLMDITIYHTNNTITIVASYSSDTGMIMFTVSNLGDYYANIQLEESVVDNNRGTYESGGTIFEIMSNNDQMIAVWKDAVCTYVLNGSVDTDELKLMLDSIK